MLLAHEQPKLQFSFNIIMNELTHIPLLHGVMFLHWKAGSREGFSSHLPVKNHQIQYLMSTYIELDIAVDRATNVLEDVMFKISVNQETEGGQNYVRFGQVSINLSEYAGTREVTKKFLLEHSRTNAALSVSIFSILKGGGAPFFKTPDSAKKFVRLEDEEMEDENGDRAFRAHSNMHEDVVMSDNRAMIRERGNLTIPKYIVDTRVEASDVIDKILGKYLKEDVDLE